MSTRTTQKREVTYPCLSKCPPAPLAWVYTSLEQVLTKPPFVLTTNRANGSIRRRKIKPRGTGGQLNAKAFMGPCLR